MNIQAFFEKSRGCGFRKPGGLYLRLDGGGIPCGRFPITLTSCPVCGGGIHPARGFTWAQASLFNQGSCSGQNESHCKLRCKDPLSLLPPETPVGLIWVGKKYYPTPEAFLSEARKMGISRKIPAVPNDFIVGETWVVLAMRDLPTGRIIEDEEGNPEPETENQAFMMFKPDRIEYVVKGDETEEELERKVKQGLTLINVIPDKGQELFDASKN
jgi:hypothetical protein